MKAIRRGDWTANEVRDWAMEKEKALETAYVACKLPERPPVEPLRQLLYNCLEEHYGSLEGCVEQVGWAESSKPTTITLQQYKFTNKPNMTIG